MIISDTPSKPFSKILIDFVGPKEATRLDNQYILTMQDNFSKYCILVPTKHATAEEVTRALTEKLISYFGPPAVIISDQGTHFVNKMMNEFAKAFNINKFCTTPYHPQSQIQSSTVQSYKYSTISNTVRTKWYSETEPETPSSFPPRGELLTYSKYRVDATQSLAQLRTLAAMNLAQAKYKSKFYYDQK